MIRHFASTGLAVILASFAVCAGSQEAYPSRPIKVVVPLTVGGAPDTVGRIAAEHLQKVMKSPVIVENRPGAGGAPGTEYVIKAEPDGYTLLLGGGSFTVLQLLNKNFPYDVTKEIEPVTMICRGSPMIAARQSTPFNNAKELLQYAKANPGRVTYATNGPGWNFFLFENLKQTAGIELFEVPYKGVIEGRNALAAGQIDLHLDVPSALRPLADAGKIKGILFMGRRSSPIFPDVSIPSEVGLGGLRGEYWYGLFAPRGTPSAIVSKLSDAIESLDAGARQKILGVTGADFIGGGPAPLRQQLEAEIAIMKNMAQRAGIKPQ